MSLITNLESYWSLDESSGTNRADSIGSNTGTASGGVGIITGKLSYGNSFDGVDDKIQFAQNYNWERTQPYSVSLWYKYNGGSGFTISNLSSLSSAIGNIWIIYSTLPSAVITMGLVHDRGAGFAIRQWTAPAILKNGNWHNVIFTYNGNSKPTGMACYINGSLHTDIGADFDYLGNTTVAASGSILTAQYARNFSGLDFKYSKDSLDEIGIWKRALSSTEVSLIYNAGNALPLTQYYLPIVSTTAISDISYYTATGGGNVTYSGNSAISARGICWNTSTNPTTANSHTTQTGTTGSFISYLTGLTPYTTYYVRAYATNSYGTGYGNVETFNTLGAAPTVVTSAITITSPETASGGGVVSATDYTTVTERGICWNTTGTPTTANSHTHDGTGTGSFSSSLTGLSANITYYVRAYAVNSIAGTVYGNQVTFIINYVTPTLTGNTTNLIIIDNNDLNEHYEIYGNKCLATYAPLNETSGTKAYDYGYNELTGTTNGTFVNSGRTGGYYCLKLPSEGKYVNFGNKFRYNLDTVPFTMTLWVNNFGYPNSEILGTGGNGYNGYLFGFGSIGIFGGKLHFYKTGNDWGKFAYANQTLGSGWHFLAVTFDGSNTASGITFYYDNNKLTTIVYADNPVGNHELSFSIGNRTFSNSFYGLVEDFRVYDCCLTDTEITDIYTGTSEYILLNTIDYPTLTYPISGDCTTNNYKIRAKFDSVSPIVYSNYSNVYSIYLISPPSGLSASNISITYLTLSWVNSDCDFDGNYVYVYSGGTWVQIADLASSATTFTVTGLTRDTTYIFRIGAYNGDDIFYSELLEVSTLDYLSNFCSSAAYVISASTCGTSGGSITITNIDYFIFYDFILTDTDSNSYTFNATTGQATGLTSGYYFLTATPKYEWWYYYGKDSCTFEWIEIEDSDSDIVFVSLKLKHAICGGFGSGSGRILIQISGVTGVTFTLWNERLDLIDQQTVTGVTSAITNVYIEVSPDIYYVQLETSAGCKYLTGLVKIQKTDLYTVTGIQRLFITPWSATTSYNYYSSSDEDWYVTGIDTLQYTSTKIKEYVDLSDFWYEIKLDTAVMSYAETFQKDQNGLTYAETVTISIPRAENSKWKQLTNILTGRYIIVFQDNHEQWWTCFYRWGADVKSYSLSENQYVITFRHPSVNKMLTAIDYNYVKLNIL